MGDGAAVKELLDDGKDPNARQSDGITPLMIAVNGNDLAIATLLLSKGADPNLRAPGGVNALAIAKARGVAGVPMVQLLQRSGARE
jgi:ankyrin repeat protein